jgi:hypothetical protein
VKYRYVGRFQLGPPRTIWAEAAYVRYESLSRKKSSSFDKLAFGSADSQFAHHE